MTSEDAIAAAIATGCACSPNWPSLAVTRDDDTSVLVLASETPGPMARLYYAHCARCGVQYPGPFRLPPRPPSCRPTRATGSTSRQAGRLSITCTAAERPRLDLDVLRGNS